MSDDRPSLAHDPEKCATLVFEMSLAGKASKEIRAAIHGADHEITALMKAIKPRILKYLVENREEAQVDRFLWALQVANDDEIEMRDRLTAHRQAIDVFGLRAPERVAPVQSETDEPWQPVDPQKLAGSLIERITQLALEHKAEQAPLPALESPREVVPEPKPTCEDEDLNKLFNDLAD